MAIDLAMVAGFTGVMRSVPLWSACTTGAHPAEGLRHLGQDRAPGRRHDDVLGEPPAELLGDLESVGLRPLSVVGAHVDVDEGPPLLVRDFTAEAVDVVVVAAD